MKKFLLSVSFVILSLSCHLFGQNVEQDTLSEDYLKISLNKLDDKLEGEIEDFNGFILSMNLPIEFPEKEFTYNDLIDLVRNQEITGLLKYPENITSIYAGQSTKVRYEVVNHRNVDEIYMKTTLGFFLWEYVNIQNDKLTFFINWWYCPPPSKTDLEILKMARKLLENPLNWDHNDDRKCEKNIENNSWSLFCALKHSSIEVMGEYNHHNTAIQTVRFVIDDLIPDHGFKHTLMDYNNLVSTQHKDILNVLDLALNRINQQIENKGLHSK